MVRLINPGYRTKDVLKYGVGMQKLVKQSLLLLKSIYSLLILHRL